MLSDSSVLKMADRVLIRFEENFKDGTLFLYNLNTQQVWSGNRSVYDFVLLIDSKRNLEEIYTEIMPLFQGYSEEEVRNCFDSVAKELVTKGFLETI